MAVINKAGVLHTELCDLLGIDYPIIQGGMAWVATSSLAAAVSEAGGLGVMGAGNAPPEVVREEIRRIRQKTKRPFGVNVYFMSPYADEIVDLVIEEGVPVVSTGAGNPGKHVSRLKEAGARVLSLVSSVNLARRLERAGVDAVIAEGMECGGHIGQIATFPLVPQIADAVKIPVVAAGGVFDGRGLAAALALGACGVQMGTRFVCARESVAHPNLKKAIIAAKDRSTVVTGAKTGHPVRVLNNKFAREFLEAEEKGASVEELEALGAGRLRAAVIDGDVDQGSLMAGQVAAMVTREETCQEIIGHVVAGAEEVLQRLARMSNTQ